VSGRNPASCACLACGVITDGQFSETAPCPCERLGKGFARTATGALVQKCSVSHAAFGLFSIGLPPKRSAVTLSSSAGQGLGIKSVPLRKSIAALCCVRSPNQQHQICHVGREPRRGGHHPLRALTSVIMQSCNVGEIVAPISSMTDVRGACASRNLDPDCRGRHFFLLFFGSCKRVVAPHT
jgi:hypothetical protein